MAWTAPSTMIAGHVVTAAEWNTDIRDNLNALRLGSIAIVSQAANDVIFASSASQFARAANFSFDGTSLSVPGSFIPATSTGGGTGPRVYFNSNILTIVTGTSGVQVLAQNNSTTLMLLTNGGVLQLPQFAAAGHQFVGGGVGDHNIVVRNSSAGTGNSTSLYVGNDSSASRLTISTLASSYTSAGRFQAEGSVFENSGTGGLSIGATQAAGVIRFYGNGTTQRMQIAAGVTVGDTTDPGATNFRVAGTVTIGGNLIAGSNWLSGDGGNEGVQIDASGNVTHSGVTTMTGRAYLGDTSDANVTLGLTINQGAADDYILTLKSSDVAHGMTTDVETDTYGAFGKFDGAAGALRISGWGESTLGIWIEGKATTGDTTKSNSAVAPVMVNAFKKSGTAVVAMGTNENIITFSPNAGGSVKFILDADGDSHQDVGTAWTNFDDHDDVALLTALSAGVSREGDPVRESFAAVLEQHRPALEAARIVTFNDNGHHFVNWSRLNMLKVGAIRQISARLVALEAQVRRLELAT